MGASPSYPTRVNCGTHRPGASTRVDGARSRLFGATFSARPFRRHLFRCWTFSAQIVSASIRYSLTVQLLKVRVWVRVSQKALNIGAEKVRAEIVVPKNRGPNGAERGWYKTLYE